MKGDIRFSGLNSSTSFIPFTSFASLFWRPVRRFVVSLHGELVGLRAVRQHGPDLASAGARGLEHNVAAVGSPGWPLVAPRIAGDLHDLSRADVHDVNI